MPSMIEVLLAQLVSPTVHPGQIKFPEKQLIKGNNTIRLELELPTKENERDSITKGKDERSQKKIEGIRIKGDTIYSEATLKSIFRDCSKKEEVQSAYRRCAIALSTRYAADGYITTKAYEVEDNRGEYILVVPGRIAEVSITSKKNSVIEMVSHYTRGLKNKILNMNDLNRQLSLTKRMIPGIGVINAKLSRLGSDQSKARLLLDVRLEETKVRGRIEIGNEGVTSAGEFDLQAVIFKNSAFKLGDSLLVYNEEYFGRSIDIGQTLSSLSYRYPVNQRISLISGLSYTKQFEPDTRQAWDDFSSTQFQYSIGLELGVNSSLRNKVTIGTSLVSQNSKLMYQGQALPDTVPGIIRNQKAGYMQVDVSHSGVFRNTLANNKLYFIKALPTITPEYQIEELQEVGRSLDNANALGIATSISYGQGGNVTNSISAFGQYAFGRLSEPMRFTLGSGLGLKGLPDQFVSGDSGWGLIGKSKIRLSRDKSKSIFISPYIGYGYVHTDTGGFMFDETVGSYGIFVELQTKRGIGIELGYLRTLLREELKASWNEWLLGNGLYARMRYSF